MKCPKCEYLGYETGIRCRHCGYEFSLIDTAPAGDLRLHEADRQTPASTAWLDQFTLDGSKPPASAAAASAAAPAAMAASAPGAVPSRDRAASAAALPLFSRGMVADDEPLIKLPAAPRAPLSVRRTPDTPRLRAVSRAVPRRAEPEPSLDFRDEAGAAAAESASGVAGTAVPEPSRQRRQPLAAAPASVGEPGGAVARLLAALLDHGLLLAIDAAVLYFTLRIASLPPTDWVLLPAVPVAFFLGLIKIGYFAAFTAIGGQTIGKMAAGLIVVSDGGQSIDPGRAVKRALAGAVSLLIGGLGFLPAVLAADRRALHDRVAGTRVIVRTG
jgi:uncharacterized RDD family membrane protein YckC